MDGGAVDWDELYAWIISGTGWTWETVDCSVTLPQLDVLAKFWRSVPPAPVQLKRISLALGLTATAPQDARRGSADDAMREAAAAGLPVMPGRPDDPMLDLLGI